MDRRIQEALRAVLCRLRHAASDAQAECIILSRGDRKKWGGVALERRALWPHLRGSSIARSEIYFTLTRNPNAITPLEITKDTMLRPKAFLCFTSHCSPAAK